MTKADNDWKEIHAMIRALDDAALGALFREYIEESAHQGFDGFTSREKTGIRMMLVDMALYDEARYPHPKEA